MIIGIDASRANVIEKTGTEWYSWHVIRRLVPLLAEHEIRLYTREPLRGGLEHLGPNCRERVLRWPPGLLWSHVRLSWELLLHPPDLLFIPADTVPIIHPKSTITTIHDVAFERWPELYRGQSVQRRMGWLRPFVHFAVRIFTFGRYSASERDYHRWSVRHALRASKKILTVSEFSKKEIIATLGAKENQIYVTPLGVRQSTELADINPTSIHATQLRFGLEKPYILFIGRLEEKKNIRLLLDAYRQYRQLTGNPVDLVLLGSPGYGWEAVEKSILPKDRPAIHQVGWVDEQVRWNIHAGAQAFIFLSAYEGFGLPPLESMSLGVPVLSSRHGSLPEVLGTAAMYAEIMQPENVAENMLKILSDHELREQLRQKGRERVQMYTWDRTAQLTLNAFFIAKPTLAKHS